MRKMAVITGTRAEYGLLRPLIDLISNSEDTELCLMATGMHLSPEFGFTIKEILNDGFHVEKEIEILLSSNSGIGVAKSMGLAMISFSEALKDTAPDVVIVLGDRSEIFAAVTAAYILGIPVAHISGGETTEGAYDEGIRHGITKMSYFHFPSTHEYAKRIIQLGEDPARVRNVGAMSLDSIKKLSLLEKTDFEKSINFKVDNRTILLTYHPVTLENKSSREQFECVLTALDDVKDLRIIFTKPNSDKGGREIIEMIDNYVQFGKHPSAAFISLGQLRYLSALKHVVLVIGNSSSGLVEVPHFNIPTINIGNRQRGRLMPETVMQSSLNSTEISDKIEIALSAEFKKSLKKFKNPYGDGTASEQIFSILKNKENIDLSKKFYDLDYKI
ncbi:UDP-N-acetylglucosamine 2-epimerase [Christiangramia portivictoriae]|uniref:UDP-N-acetylglucosamine 2-epimerase n=1 Tax=Christiangramia portivictoriae TaxID=326069 RepID=UPI00047D27A1|nr:UDP-N-acetylglucosamine 2-epimerase [Christiangramia portivictoriae]